MISAFSFGSELRRFSREKLPRLALVAIIFLPLLYGAMYLWAYWNPLGKVDRMPVAIVNSDYGAQVDGLTVRVGEQVTRELIRRGDLGWERVPTRDQALAGVENGRYYFAVEFPTDFSEAVTSPARDNPRKAIINVTYNDANSALGSTIAETAMDRILNVLSEQIGAQAVDQVLVGLQTVRGGLVEAAEGSGQLADGTGALRSGVAELDDGANLLATNLHRASDGAAELASGTAQLDVGINELSTGLMPLAQGLRELQDGARQLGAGAQQISQGVNQIVAQLDVLAARQAELTAAIQAKADHLYSVPHPVVHDAARELENLRIEIETEGLGPGARSDLQRLRDGAAQLAYQLGDPASPFRSGLAAAAEGGDQLVGAITQLRDGSGLINAGAQELSAGLQQLAGGGDTLTAGVGRLGEGAVLLDEGANELATRLDEGAQQIPDWNENERRSHAEIIGGPVGLDPRNLASAATFGVGVAPFFISLALFIGGFIIWMVMRPLQTRALAAGLNGLRTVMASYWPAAVISVAQGVVMYGVIRYLLGLEPANPAGMLGFLILTGLSFLAFTQALFVVLGNSTARVAVLALLMVNLVSAGGLYPPETTGRLFELIHPFIPMSYSVSGLRQMIIGSTDGRIGLSITVLTGLLVGSLAVAAFAAHRQQEWTMKRLHPSLKV